MRSKAPLQFMDFSSFHIIISLERHNCLQSLHDWTGLELFCLADAQDQVCEWVEASLLDLPLGRPKIWTDPEKGLDKLE